MIDPEPKRCVICDVRLSRAEPGHQSACIRADMDRAMGPDHSKTGIFVNHNCAYCDDGRLPCRQGAVHRCDNPRARND